MLKIKAYSNGREIKKIIELHHLPFYFDGMGVLSREWKITPFRRMGELAKEDGDLFHTINIVLIGLIYKSMCTNKGWEVQLKRFKNQMLLKSKASFIFTMHGEFQEIEEHYFDKAIKWLKLSRLVGQGSHGAYIKIASYSDYCHKLGNYLFDTPYARTSFERNTHYFGTHNSLEHERAYDELKILDRRKTLVLN
jgi:hypothetical protein